MTGPIITKCYATQALSSDLERQWETICNVRLLKIWRLCKHTFGGGLQNGKIAARNLFESPLRQGKTFVTPVLKIGNFCAPPLRIDNRR